MKDRGLKPSKLPWGRAQRLEARKAAVLDFVSHALFAAPAERAKKKKKKNGKGSERKK